MPKNNYAWSTDSKRLREIGSNNSLDRSHFAVRFSSEVMHKLLSLPLLIYILIPRLKSFSIEELGTKCSPALDVFEELRNMITEDTRQGESFVVSLDNIGSIRNPEESGLM